MSPAIQQQLLHWFYHHQRSMPWRENPSPYKVWISEIMLQQTTVATVHDYFLRFIERFPTLESLAKADEEEVLTLWSGLGYYSRARNILKTAQIIQSEKNFPQNYQELLKLPGIGPYTAGAISSMAFHKAVSLVDTNVDRVLGRFFTLERKDSDFENTLRCLAQKLIEKIHPTDIWAWNQAIMELGALICKARSVECYECPLNQECKAFASENPLTFPGDKIKLPKIEKTEYALLIQREEKFLLQKITTGTRRKGLYDFIIVDEPCGEIFTTINYTISNNKMTRVCYIVKNIPLLNSSMIWLSIDDALTNYPLVSPCKKILKKL